MMTIRMPVAVVFLSLSLAAQSTLIVDSSGGGNFLDLPPAIAAAQPGDLVLVRPGYYSGATVSIGIRIVGLPGAMIADYPGLGPELLVDRVPAGQTCVVRGFGFSSVVALSVQVLDCQGQVHLEDLTPVTSMDVQRSAAVSLLNVTVSNSGTPLHVADSSVAVVSCDLSAGFGLGTPRHAISIERSTVVVSQSQLMGGNSYSAVDPGAGIELVSGHLIVAGDSSSSISAGFSAGGVAAPTPAIQGTAGTILIDPQVQLTPQYGAAAIAGAATVTMAQVPTVLADVAAQTLSVDVRGTAGDYVVVLVGLAPQPVTSTPFGDVWLGAGSVEFQSAQVPPTGALATSVPLPVLPPGLLVTFQGAVLRGNQLLLTTPVSTTLD